MKSSKLVYLLIACSAIALMATGCKLPQNTKRIPGNRSYVSKDSPPAPPLDDANKIEPVEQPHPIDNTDYTTWNHDPKAFEAQTIYFAFDSVTINSADKAKAEMVASYLQSNPQCAVLIEGHCDERGTEEYNRSLGERRALAGREALIAAGIEPKRTATISYGEDNPTDPGHNEAAWKKNRRAAFVLLTPPQ